MAEVFAKFSAWVTPTVYINAGDSWDADDQLVAAHPDWFSDRPLRVHQTGDEVFTEETAGQLSPVEQATKAPGEKRTTRRPTK